MFSTKRIYFNDGSGGGGTPPNDELAKLRSEFEAYKASVAKKAEEDANVLKLKDEENATLKSKIKEFEDANLSEIDKLKAQITELQKIEVQYTLLDKKHKEAQTELDTIKTKEKEANLVAYNTTVAKFPKEVQEKIKSLTFNEDDLPGSIEKLSTFSDLIPGGIPNLPNPGKTPNGKQTSNSNSTMTDEEKRSRFEAHKNISSDALYESFSRNSKD